MKVEGMNMDWTPEHRERYYYPIFTDEKLYDYAHWFNDNVDFAIKRNVGVYRTEEEAIAKAKELGWT